MHLSKEDFFKHFNLTEDLYLANTSRFKVVDQLFQEIIDLLHPEAGILVEDRKKVDQIIAKIAKVVSGIFNINLDMEIDWKRNSEIMNFAYTQISDDLYKKIFSDLKEVHISKKYGYHFVTMTDVMVRFEAAIFREIAIINSGKSDLKGFDRFTGRHLTEILLHEIGHNVFIFYRLDYDEAAKKYTFEAEGVPRIVMPDKMKFVPNILEKFFSISAFLVLFLSTAMFSAGILYLVSFGFAITGYISALFANKFGFKNFKGKYMEIEGHANNLPFQYGYGTEILDSTIYIPYMTDRQFLKKNLKAYKKAQNEWPYQTMIVRDVLKMIQDEQKDPNITPEGKAYLKKLLDYVNNDLKTYHKALEIHTNYEESE